MLKVAISLVFLLSEANQSNAETAIEMHDYCQGIADAQLKATGQILVPTTFEAGTCWGAFSAFGTLSMAIFDDSSGFALRICAPPRSSRLQLVRVFRQHVMDHPERGHEDWAIVALAALQEAFPCD
jgi:hypothetical protein